MLRSSLLFSVAALAAVVTAAPAVAVTPSKALVDNTLTRTELQACMDRQATLEKRRTSYGTQVKQVNAAGEAISQEGAALSAEQGKVDTKSAAAVNAFKEKIAGYEKRAAAYNARAKDLQESESQIQTLEKSYAADCSSKTFNAADRDAILAERAAKQPVRKQ